jgi:hypothetical protein
MEVSMTVKRIPNVTTMIMNKSIAKLRPLGNVNLLLLKALGKNEDGVEDEHVRRWFL